MENALFFTIILLFAELFEAYIQRSQTLLGVLEKLYAYYQKSIFLFFLIFWALNRSFRTVMRKDRRFFQMNILHISARHRIRFLQSGS